MLETVVSTSSAQSIDDFVVGVALSLGVVVGLGGSAFVVVECERSADRDVTTMSLVSSRAFATCSSLSFLTLFSSFSSFSSSLSSPSLSLSLFVLSLVALRAWLVVESGVGGVCGGSADEAAVASSVDVGDEFGSTSRSRTSCVMGSQWELNAAGSRFQ